MHSIRIDRAKPLAEEPHVGHNRYHPDIAPVAEIGEGELRLRTRRQAIREAQAIVARYLPKGRDLVQELIDERRDEAARE